MTRYQYLQVIYNNQDTIYLAMIMISAWAAGFGHMLDWMTHHHAHLLVPIFWGLMVTAYISGMVYLLAYFS
jgi:hypothetical protein